MPSMCNHPTKTLTEIRLLRLCLVLETGKNLSKLIRVRFLLLIWANWTTWQSTNRKKLFWVWNVLDCLCHFTNSLNSSITMLFQVPTCFERCMSGMRKTSNSQSMNKQQDKSSRCVARLKTVLQLDSHCLAIQDVVNPLYWNSFSITFHRSSCIILTLQ